MKVLLLFFFIAVCQGKSINSSLTQSRTMSCLIHKSIKNEETVNTELCHLEEKNNQDCKHYIYEIETKGITKGTPSCYFSSCDNENEKQPVDCKLKFSAKMEQQ